MKQFAFFFRQSPLPLSEEQQRRRTEGVRAWATQQQQEGRRLDLRILTAECVRITRNAQSPADLPLVAALFFEEQDLDEAARIAQTHPGLHYGVDIEVRGWTPPAASPPVEANSKGMKPVGVKR
jgi:hypothetical protein